MTSPMYTVEVVDPATGEERWWISRPLPGSDARLVWVFVKKHFPSWHPSLKVVMVKAVGR